jgi:hypothetical protein
MGAGTLAATGARGAARDAPSPAVAPRLLAITVGTDRAEPKRRTKSTQAEGDDEGEAEAGIQPHRRLGTGGSERIAKHRSPIRARALRLRSCLQRLHQHPDEADQIDDEQEPQEEEGGPPERTPGAAVGRSRPEFRRPRRRNLDGDRGQGTRSLARCHGAPPRRPHTLEDTPLLLRGCEPDAAPGIGRLSQSTIPATHGIDGQVEVGTEAGW